MPLGAIAIAAAEPGGARAVAQAAPGRAGDDALPTPAPFVRSTPATSPGAAGGIRF